MAATLLLGLTGFIAGCGGGGGGAAVAALQFSIAANGSLTPLATSTLPTGGNPRYITLYHPGR